MIRENVIPNEEVEFYMHDIVVLFKHKVSRQSLGNRSMHYSTYDHPWARPYGRNDTYLKVPEY